MSVLPPNATSHERAITAAMGRIAEVPVRVDDLWDPATCPPEQLPWLAWALSVDDWDPSWSEAQKRAAIRVSYFVHRHKGTAAAVRASLAALGYETRVLEWFEESPPATPYTFAVDIEVTDRGIGEQTYIEAERMASSAKNVRSHLSRIRAIARTNGALYLGAATVGGEIVEVRPFQLGELAARALVYVGTALATSETTSIYPEGAHA